MAGKSFSIFTESLKPLERGRVEVMGRRIYRLSWGRRAEKEENAAFASLRKNLGPKTNKGAKSFSNAALLFFPSYSGALCFSSFFCFSLASSLVVMA